MKKLISAICIVAVSFAACTENDSTKETIETTETTEATSTMNSETKVDDRTTEIKDSTKMLDKKLSDPNSTYSPDSLK
jgi:thioredoxin-related protein